MPEQRGVELQKSAAASGDGWYLAGIVVLALAVRLWGIGFGLPNEHARPDERHLIGFTPDPRGNRLNPGFFNYPSLYLYLLFTLYVLYFVIGLGTGHFTAVKDLVAEYSLAPAPLYLIDRVLVACLGTATVILLYWIGKRVVGRRTGLLSALFLSVAYLHVRDSHFGTVDVPVTFFVSVAIALILKADDTRSLKAYVLAGFACGLAVSTKYNAIALLAPLGLAQVTNLPIISAPILRQRAIILAASGAAVVVGFLLGTPYALLDWSTFIGDVSFEFGSKAHEPPIVELGPGWLYHSSVTLPNGVGLPLLIAAVVGVVVGLRERPRLALLLVSFPIVWFCGIGLSHWVYVRYGVPLVPFVCVFAAWAIDAALRELELRLGVANRSVKAAALLAVVVALAIPVWNVVQWDRLVRRTDSRVLAEQWFEQHAENGASVGVVGPNFLRPQLWNAPPQILRAKADGPGRKLRNEMRLAFMQRTHVVAFEEFVFEGGAWHDVLNTHFIPSEQPVYIVIGDHPVWRPGPGDLPKVPDDYVEVASFEAFSAPARQAVYDWQDAVYFPFAGFEGVTRPGPNLRVYRRVAR